MLLSARMLVQAPVTAGAQTNALVPPRTVIEAIIRSFSASPTGFVIVIVVALAPVFAFCAVRNASVAGSMT